MQSEAGGMGKGVEELSFCCPSHMDSTAYECFTGKALGLELLPMGSQVASHWEELQEVHSLAKKERR